jgi:periplasmic protein TonB
MSLTFSDRAPQPKSYVGIGLVVVLHLAGIYALSAGLIRVPTRPPEIAPIKPLPAEPKDPPPPTEPYRADKPIMKDPITTPVAPREDWVIEKDQVIVEPQRPSQPPVTTGPGTIKAELPPTPTGVKNPPITSPGAVCSVMPRPEVPVVNWTGDAVLQVIATVRGGRVVGTDFRVAQGALDSKTKRSLQRSVESALSGYQCEGDATFQQDFAFRID